jgi:hypothetical protein
MAYVLARVTNVRHNNVRTSVPPTIIYYQVSDDIEEAVIKYDNIR